MDFGFQEETLMLKNNAERYLKEKVTGTLVKNLLKEEKGFSAAIWKDMADMGWLGLIFEEKYGGSGASFFDLFVLSWELGKSVLPSPFTPAVLAGLVIAEGAEEKVKEEMLPPLIGGQKIFTLGLLDEAGKYDFATPRLEAREAGADSFVLRGTRTLVPYAHAADAILVCAAVKGGKTGPTLFRVEAQAAGQKRTPLEVISGEKTFALTFENTPAERIGALGQGAAAVEKIIPKAVALKCGEMVGGMERVLAMTVEYSKQRVQFGKPLGTLQVLQHYMADMATLADTSRLIACQAACLLSEGVPCAQEVATAKAWCSDAYKKATWTAHQIHGGIGFTEEHDLHLYFKHAKTAELEFGDSWVHRQKVADAMGI